MNSITRNLTLAATLLGGAALAPQVVAAERYSLGFEPAKVESVADMQRLHAQIHAVAKDYCPNYQQSRSFQVVKSCLQAVSADLVEKVGQPAFSAFVEKQAQSPAAALIASSD